ncbi:MAG: diguanylate cyclase [Alphaproteobacteria bacterium]
MRFAINDKILLQVFAFVGCSMAVLGGFVWYSAVQQDEIAAEHSIDSARTILQEELDRIGMVAKDFSWRNDAVRHLDIAFSVNWAASNLSYYVHDKHGYDISMVINRDDRTVFSQIDGRSSVHSAEEILEGGLPRMIAEARKAPWRKPEAVTGLLAMDQSLVMVAVCAVSLEQNANIKMAEGDRVVVVLARRMTPLAVTSLMDSPQLKNIALSMDVDAPVPADSATLLLHAPAGEPIGRLTWIPFQPGRKFLESVAPALFAGVVAILGFTWLLIWRVRSTTRAIKRSETRFRDVADASSDWIWETNGRGELQFLSEQFAISTGTATDAVIGKPIGELLRPIGGVNKIRKFQKDLKGQQHFRDFLCRYVDATGKKKTLRVAGKPFYSAKGKFQGFRGTATDITSEIDAKRRIQHLALHDSLTNLPNRTHLAKRVSAAVESVGRGTGKAAVLCIDLDRFKEINDTLGHSAGDLLIKGCADRLRSAVRPILIAAHRRRHFDTQTTVDQPQRHRTSAVAPLKLDHRPYDLDGHEVLVSASTAPPSPTVPGRRRNALLQRRRPASTAPRKTGATPTGSRAGMDGPRLHQRTAAGARPGTRLRSATSSSPLSAQARSSARAHLAPSLAALETAGLAAVILPSAFITAEVRRVSSSAMNGPVNARQAACRWGLLLR